MDLEKYKKAWGNQPEGTNKVSAIDIYKMAHSRSSSIVKWIFIIGILEFVFWFAINFFMPKSYLDIYKELNLYNFIMFTQVLHYVVIVLFLILFYRNYSSISVVDSTKILIQKILKVRKTVKYYVYYNLIGFVVLSVIINILMFSSPDNLIKVFEAQGTITSLNESQFLTAMLIAQIITLLIILLILYLFYKLLYGILLKKLNRNYKELNKLEKSN